MPKEVRIKSLVFVQLSKSCQYQHTPESLYSKYKISNERLEMGFNILVENLKELKEVSTDSNWKSKRISWLGGWEGVGVQLLNSERVFVSLPQLLSIA